MSLALLLALSPAVAQSPVPDMPLPIRFMADEEVVADQPTDDLFGMAQEVRVGGAIADNAFLMGEDIRIDAPIFGDLFSMASEVRIEAPVHGDVYALAGDVIVGPNGSVDGHIHAMAGDVSLEGPVGGDLDVGAGVLTLGAPVGGNLRLEVGELVVQSGASVAGNVDYQAPMPTAGLEDIVAGRVTFTESVDEGDIVIGQAEEEEESSLLSGVVWWTAFRAWGYGSKLIVGFVLLALGGAVTGHASRTLVSQPARSLGLGFTVASVTLIGSIVALALILPFPLGILGLVTLTMALYLGQLVAAQALGDLALKRFRPEAWGSPYLSMAIGLVPLVLVSSLPWIGTLAWFVATIFGLGAMWLHLRSLASA